MSNLVLIEYENEASAEAARDRLLELEKDCLINLEDAVVAVRQDATHVKLNQLVNLTTFGATSGGIWGAWLGLLVANPILGAAVGAGAGALVGHFSDTGINDDMIRHEAETLAPGHAVLGLLVKRVTADKVVPELARFGGAPMQGGLAA